MAPLVVAAGLKTRWTQAARPSPPHSRPDRKPSSPTCGRSASALTSIWLSGARRPRPCRKRKGAISARRRRRWTSPHPMSAVSPLHVRGARLKVGIVSNFFSKHTVGYLSRGLVTHLTAPASTSCCSGHPGRQGQHHPQIRRRCSHRRPAARSQSRTPGDRRRRPRHSALSRNRHGPLHLFPGVRAPAHLQTMGWGHPITSGLPNIDMFLWVDADGSHRTPTPITAKAGASARAVVRRRTPRRQRRSRTPLDAQRSALWRKPLRRVPGQGAPRFRRHPRADPAPGQRRPDAFPRLQPKRPSRS